MCSRWSTFFSRKRRYTKKKGEQLPVWKRVLEWLTNDLHTYPWTWPGLPSKQENFKSLREARTHTCANAQKHTYPFRHARTYFRGYANTGAHRSTQTSPSLHTHTHPHDFSHKRAHLRTPTHMRTHPRTTHARAGSHILMCTKFKFWCNLLRLPMVSELGDSHIAERGRGTTKLLTIQTLYID